MYEAKSEDFMSITSITTLYDKTDTKKVTGWNVVRDDGATFTITDTDGDGKYTKADLAKAMSGEVLTKEDCTEIYYQSRNQEAGLTAEESAEYSKFKEVQEAQRKQKELQESQQLQYQQRQQQFQQKQYKQSHGFWGTFNNIFTNVLGTASTIMSAFLGFGFNNWQYNSDNANDMQLRMFTGMTGMMFNNAGAMQGLYGGIGNNYSTLTNPNFATSSGSQMGDMLNNAMQAQETLMKQRQDAMNAWLQKSSEQAAKAKEEAENKAAVKDIESYYTSSQKDRALICKENKKAIKDMYDPSAENYTKEQIATFNKIKELPEIPYTAVAKDDKEKGKLPKVLAEKINKLISDYENADGNDQAKILSKNNYTTLKTTAMTLASKGMLTDQLITQIKDIIKNPTDKKD